MFLGNSFNSVSKFDEKSQEENFKSHQSLEISLSTVTLLHSKMIMIMDKKNNNSTPPHTGRANPVFVIRQWAGSYCTSKLKHSSPVSCILTDTSVHISSLGRKKAWEWNVATHHEPAGCMYWKKGDPRTLLCLLECTASLPVLWEKPSGLHETSRCILTIMH